MKTPVPENIMAERRLERLERLRFFMRSDRVPENARTLLGRGACLNLLTGFFQNSHWRTAWWVVCEAAKDTWMEWSVSRRLFWHYRIMRRTPEEVDEIFER